jgi:hypothetical protein
MVVYGSILLWAHKGLPLIDANGPTERVHGSQRRWGRWVETPEIEVVY